MMNGGILALSLLFLLTLASQSPWCVADSSTTIYGDDHLQLQGFHGKKNLEIQSPRKLGRGQSRPHNELSAVEIKHYRRVAIGHKGGGVGSGRSAGGGGGGAVMRPHNNKNGAAALPAPAVSVLVLSLACLLALSAFSY